MKLFVLFISMLVPVLLVLAGCQNPNTDFGPANAGSVDNRALDSGKAPGQNFDLSHFKIQLPVASGSGVLEISQPQLATYTSSYFLTAGDGAMTFWTPVTGATTSGSSYPRSELRDLNEWTMSGTHTQTGTVKIQQAPSTGKIIFGQIHGSITGSEALKLRWTNGDIIAGTKTTVNASESQTTITTGVGIGSTITYTIQSVGKTVTITVNGHSISKTYDSSWTGVSVYFKAGCYIEDNSGSSSEGGKVAYYALNGTVSATPTPTPAATPTPIGSTPTPTPVATSKTVGLNAWINTTLAAQTGSFSFAFDAKPSALASNSIIGLSTTAAAAPTDLAAIVRFNPTNTIDVRNGGAYAATVARSYTANSTYHFRMVVNVAAHTYSVYVTAPGSTEQTLASNYAFRSEQVTVSSLNNWAANVAASGAGNLAVSNYTVQ